MRKLTNTKSAPPDHSSRASRGSPTRQKILSAALRLFSRQGYDGTSTKQICDTAGVNTAAIAYHFETKEKLLNAIFAARMNEDSFAINQVLKKAKTPEEFKIKIRMLCDLVVGLQLKNQDFHRLIANEAAYNPNAFQAFKKGVAPFHRGLAEFLKDGKKKGFVSPGVDLQTVSFFIFGLVNLPTSNPIIPRLNSGMDLRHPRKLNAYLSQMLRVLFYGVMSESEKTIAMRPNRSSAYGRQTAPS